MPRITDDKHSEYLERVRAIIVRRPDVSIRQIKKILEEHPKAPIKLTKDYIMLLVRKIRKNRGQRLNSYTVNVILGQFEQEVEELKKQLWTIVSNPVGSDKVKVAAIKEIRSSSMALFDKMFDAGLFEKNLGKLDIDQKLSEETEAMIAKAISHGYGERDTKNSTKPKTPDSTG